jgi:hypothetical protein
MNKHIAMKWISAFVFLIMMATLFAGCAGEQVSDAAGSEVDDIVPTIDLCVGDAKIEEARRLNRFMIRFDDISVLAQATPREQLAQIILEMQKIRQEAAFEEVQPCFTNLQSKQVNFMNGVIITMTNFLSGATAETLEAKINETRELRVQYDAELAALLGMTYVTTTPAPTVIPVSDTPTYTPAPVRAVFVGTGYIMEGPGDNYTALDTFNQNQEANIIARTADNMWIKISRSQPSQVTGWVSIHFITVDGDLNQVPVE